MGAGNTGESVINNRTLPPKAEFGSVAMEQSDVTNRDYLPGKLIVMSGRGELREQVTALE